MARAIPWLVASTCLTVVGACEPMHIVAVKAPLVAPVTTDCLTRALRAFSGREVHAAQEPPGERKGQIRHVSLTDGRTWLDQVIGADSSVILEGSTGRVGARYTPAERDSIGQRLGRLLLAARDTCSGHSLPGHPEYQVSTRLPQ